MLLMVDAGGVLFNNPIEDSPFLTEVADFGGVSRDDLCRGYEARDREFEVDQLDVRLLLRELLNELGAPTEVTRDVGWLDAMYIRNVCADAQAFRLVRDLKGGGHVLALCNNEARHWDVLKNREYGHWGLFDFIGSSWSVAQVKPDAAYFAAVRARVGISSPECVLIDDNPLVLTAASAHGIKPVSFSDAESTRRHLAEMGLL